MNYEYHCVDHPHLQHKFKRLDVGAPAPELLCERCHKPMTPVPLQKTD
jgi:hypothetical protein